MTTIAYGCFTNCTGLTSFAFPNALATIPERALYGCSSLESVTIPASVTTIKNDAFSFCPKLTSLDYAGTKADWALITVGTLSSSGTITSIVCSDGTITL